MTKHCKARQTGVLFAGIACLTMAACGDEGGSGAKGEVVMPPGSSPTPTPAPAPTPIPDITEFFVDPVRQPFEIFAEPERIALSYDDASGHYLLSIDGGELLTIVDDPSTAGGTYDLVDGVVPEDLGSLFRVSLLQDHSFLAWIPPADSYGIPLILSAGENRSDTTPPSLLDGFSGQANGFSTYEENCWGMTRFMAGGAFTGLESTGTDAHGTIDLMPLADCSISHPLGKESFSGVFSGGAFSGRFDTEVAGENFIEGRVVGNAGDEIIGKWKLPLMIDGKVEYITGTFAAALPK